MTNTTTKTVSQGDLIKPIYASLAELGKADKDSWHQFMDFANHALASLNLTLDCMGYAPDNERMNGTRRAPELATPTGLT